MPEPWITILTLVAGFATGVLSGMFGVGGAVVSTPAIRILGATPLEAVGSTIPSIVPSSVSGSLRYRREGLIISRVAGWTLAFGLAATVGGALLAGTVPGEGHLLMIITAALLAFTAYRLSSPPRPSPAPAPTPASASATVDVEDPVGDLATPAADLARAHGPEPDRSAPSTRHDEVWRLGLIGLAAGGISGLLGIGGGVLMVPAFASWVRLTIKESVATSLLCVGALAIPGMITHAVLGNIDWAFAIPLAIAVIPGAQLGAHLAIRSSERSLRLTVAIGLGSIAIVYGVGEIVALVA
ncbi:MAG TPA: sulfite exporter TauE/SafE family protein [Acidimicrobiia bacterium]|nr:sulfite exporter TauE/SafE family protein [Acidimicrobiia bacterium]